MDIDIYMNHLSIFDKICKLYVILIKLSQSGNSASNGLLRSVTCDQRRQEPHSVSPWYLQFWTFSCRQRAFCLALSRDHVASLLRPDPHPPCRHFFIWKGSESIRFSGRLGRIREAFVGWEQSRTRGKCHPCVNPATFQIKPISARWIMLFYYAISYHYRCWVMSIVGCGIWGNAGNFLSTNFWFVFVIGLLHILTSTRNLKRGGYCNQILKISFGIPGT